MSEIDTLRQASAQVKFETACELIRLADHIRLKQYVGWRVSVAEYEAMVDARRRWDKVKNWW